MTLGTPSPTTGPLAEWGRRAACANATAEFVPDAREGGNAPEALAWRYCAACPVTAECLAYAERNDLEGVWGGELLVRRGKRRLLLEGTR